jgi:stalled ribosome alternative rescue factor ArfA
MKAKRNPLRVVLKSPLFRLKVVKDKRADQNKRKCRGGVKSRPSYFMTRKYVSDTSRVSIISR